MVDSNSLSANSSSKSKAEESIPAVIAALRNGGIANAKQSYLEFEVGWLKSVSFSNFTDKDAAQLADGLEQVIERYGEEETTAMLLKRLERHQELLEDPSKMGKNPPERTVIDEEYGNFVGSFLRMATPEEMQQKMADLMGSIEDLKQTCSLDEYKGLNTMGEFFTDLDNIGKARNESLYIAAKAIEEKGLKLSWDAVTEAICRMRDPIGISKVSFVQQKKDVDVLLEQTVNTFGLEPVEDQLRKRLKAMVEVLESPQMFLPAPDFQCPPDLHEAIGKLFDPKA